MIKAPPISKPESKATEPAARPPMRPAWPERDRRATSWGPRGIVPALHRNARPAVATAGKGGLWRSLGFGSGNARAGSETKASKPAAAPAPARKEPAPAKAAAEAPPVACTMKSATQAHAPDGTPDTRRKVGVSENVEFSIGAAGNWLGEVANWSATSGSPRAATGLLNFVWTAPETPGFATITGTVPFTGAKCSAMVQVILPSALKMTKTSEDTYSTGVSGAGMFMTAEFPPNDVSFSNSQWLEVPGPATSITGYVVDMIANGFDSYHHPNVKWFTISRANTFASDHAWLVNVPPKSLLPPAWSFGTYAWVIPNKLRGVGSSSAGVHFVDSTQFFMILSSGTVLISKQGAFVSRSPW